MDNPSAELHRRPMSLRENAGLRVLARALQRRGVTPNAASVASIACAALAGACLVGSHWAAAPAAAVLLLFAPARTV